MAEDGAGGDRYPYKTPRWILWVVALVSVAAVVAAFLVGPKNDKTAGGSTTSATSTISHGRGTTTTRPTSTDSGAPNGTGSSVPGTTASPTTAPPKTTSTTAAPKATTTTTAPGGTTVTTTTTPPIVAVTPPPTAVVTVSQCRIEGASTAIAEGTVTNQGTKAWSFTVQANATDGSGATVATISTTVTAVPAGGTVNWTASTDLGANANVVSGCQRTGSATPLAA